MKQELKKIIQKAIKDFTTEPVNFSIEVPDEKTYGDYATNVAMVLAKKLKKKSSRFSKRDSR